MTDTDAPLWAEIDARGWKERVMDEHRPDDEPLLDYVDGRGWIAMVTEWTVGPQPRAMAVVACGDDDGGWRCYESASDISTAALAMAIDKARSVEDFGPLRRAMDQRAGEGMG